MPQWLFISSVCSLSHASPWNTNAVEPEMIMRMRGRKALQNNGMGRHHMGVSRMRQNQEANTQPTANSMHHENDASRDRPIT